MGEGIGNNSGVMIERTAPNLNASFKAALILYISMRLQGL